MGSSVQAVMLSSVAPAGGGGVNGFFYRHTLTIDHTKVPNTDQSNFPVLVSFTDASLKTVANGGHVQNANGFDVVFFSDSGLTTQLDHEIERYVASTGEIVMWVRIPSLSHTVDTVFYVAYGKSSISTSQENKTGVWDSNYKGVWHLGDGSTLSLADSTSNANTLTNNNAATAAAGQISGAVSLVAASSQSLSRASNSGLQGSAAFTLSGWVKPNSTGNAGYGMIFAKGTSVVRDYDLDLNPSGKLRFYFTSGGGFRGVDPSTSTLNGGVWYYIAVTYDGSTQIIYFNGVSDGSNAWSGSANAGTDDFALGKLGSDNSNYWDGLLDEMRVAQTARSADWLKTEYNNQSSPSTFHTLGSEVSL